MIDNVNTIIDQERYDQALERYLLAAGLPVQAGGVHVGDDRTTLTFRTTAAVTYDQLDFLAKALETKAIDFGAGDGGSLTGHHAMQVTIRDASHLADVVDLMELWDDQDARTVAA